MNAEWFYSEGTERKGPVTEEQLKQLIDDRQLKGSDLVWRDGMPDWVEARTVQVLFPRAERPSREQSENGSRRRFDPEVDDRPRSRSRSGDDEDDRPSRSRSRDDEDDRPSRSRRRDEFDDDDDRPRVRRQVDDYEDDYDRPRRKRNQKPSQIQAVGIMMLIGGILGIVYFLSTLCVLFWWPGIYFELVISILLIIRGSNMMGANDQGPPKALLIMQIIFILNLDIVNCILGIVGLVMLANPEVETHYRRKGFY